MLFGATLDRRALLRAVLARNPGIEAARQTWRAALAHYPDATAFDDPRVSYTLAPISLFDKDSRFGQVVQISQRLPFFGKRGMRGAVAVERARAAQHGYRSVRLALALHASDLFDAYYVVARSLAINAEHVALVTQLKRSAQARYAAGSVSQQAPLRAEVTLAHLVHHAVGLKARRGVIVARINALLHRRPGATLPPPPRSLPRVAALTADSTALQRAALATRPALQASAARIRAGRAALALQRRNYAPDISVMATYNSMWPQIAHQLMLGFSLRVPIQLSRLRARVKRAQAGLAVATSEQRRLVDRVRAEVHQARLKLVEAQHVVRLFRQRILPASQRRLTAARAGFAAGRDDFDTLIEAERGLRRAKLQLQVARATVYRRRARLDRSIGRLPFIEGRPGGER